MTRSRTQFVTEFFVIVIGVLVALAVDQLVERMGERDQARTYLARLIADLESTEEVLGDALSDWEVSASATAELLAAVDGASPNVDDQAVALAMARAGDIRNPVIVRATYADLIATGNIRLLDERGVGSRVVSYYEDELQFGQPFFDNHIDVRVRWIARELVPAEWFEQRLRECPLSVPHAQCPGPELRLDEPLVDQLRARPEIRQLLNSRSWDLTTGIRLLRRWIDLTEQLRETLERGSSSP